MISEKESQIISIIRAIAAILIVACHYVSWFPRIAATGQFFNVGIPVFFIISGFLYGQKNIGQPGRWFLKQLIKIMVPVYIYYCLGALLLLGIGKLGIVEPRAALILGLNLQGIWHGAIGNLQTGHLWFITFILLCYLVTPCLEIWRASYSNKVFWLLMTGFFGSEIIIMLEFGSLGFTSWIPGVFSYIIAYYLGAKWNKMFPDRILLRMFLIGSITIGIRLVTKHYIDGSRLYNIVIVPYTHCILGFCIFFGIYWLCDTVNTTSKPILSIFGIIAKYSFEIYIVHYCLIKGVLSLRALTGSAVINTIILVLGIAILSVGLKASSQFILKHFSRD